MGESRLWYQMECQGPFGLPPLAHSYRTREIHV